MRGPCRSPSVAGAPAPRLHSVATRDASAAATVADAHRRFDAALRGRASGGAGACDRVVAARGAAPTMVRMASGGPGARAVPRILLAWEVADAATDDDRGGAAARRCARIWI